MGEPTPSTTATSPSSLVKPSGKTKQKPIKFFQIFHYLYRFIPSLPPACKPPSLHGSRSLDVHSRTSASHRISGTIYGYSQGKVTLSLQENPKTLPNLVLEFPMQTNELQQELLSGAVRLALECEKSPEMRKLFEEPTWTVFSNGKKIGYGIKRQANQEDLHVMEVLKAVTTGAGALEGVKETERDIQYMRSQFGRIVGSKDSETLCMLNPDTKSGPELTIFFVRI
ncbi:hypothetical protein LguiA_003815 [Lonicera macranthoides]